MSDSKTGAAEVTGLVALWRYADFPYVTGGEITRIDDAGRVYAPSYQGWFAPLAIYPKAAGERILNDARRLKADYDKERADLLKDFAERLSKVVPAAALRESWQQREEGGE